MEQMSMYERKKEEIMMKYTRNGMLSPLGKWEIAKLFMLYFPDRDIQPSDYDHERN